MELCPVSPNTSLVDVQNVSWENLGICSTLDSMGNVAKYDTLFAHPVPNW